MSPQKISFAFVHKNFRSLSFETRVVLMANLATTVFCFFPWLSVNPNYGEKFFLNAFSGPGFLIGTLILLVSVSIVVIFLDKICETRKIKLPFSETNLLSVATIQQLVFIVLAWSVLFSVGRSYENASIRFGIFAIFLSQITSAVALYLQRKNETQKTARDFLQHPKVPKEKKPVGQIDFLKNDEK